MVKKNSIPERWRSLSSVGQRVQGSRFIAFKVPLKGKANQRVTPNQKFTPKDLVNIIRSQNEELGLVIDLTNTERYYTYKDLPKSVQYVKLHTAGLQIPDDCTIHQFKRIVRRFIWRNSDNEKLIGVHCTTGINRTGYLICRYLIDVDGWDPQTAIDVFAQSRGHPIEGSVYTDDLLCGMTRSNLGIDQPPTEDENYDENYGWQSQLDDQRDEKSAEQFKKTDLLEDDYGDFDARKIPQAFSSGRPRSPVCFDDEKDFLTSMPEYIERVRVARQSLEYQKQETFNQEFPNMPGMRNRAFQDSMHDGHVLNSPEMHPRRNYMNNPFPSGQPENRMYEGGPENRQEMVGKNSMFGPRRLMDIDTLDRRPMDRIMPGNGPPAREFSQGLQGRHVSYPNIPSGPMAHASRPGFGQRFPLEMRSTDCDELEAPHTFQPQHDLELTAKKGPQGRTEVFFGEQQPRNLRDELVHKNTQMDRQQLLEMQSRNRPQGPGIHPREPEIMQGPLRTKHMDGSLDTEIHPEEREYMMNKPRLMSNREGAPSLNDCDIRSFQGRNNLPSTEFRGTNRFAPYQQPTRPAPCNDFLRDHDQGLPISEKREHQGSLPAHYDYNFDIPNGGQHMEKPMHPNIPPRNRFNPR
ncbi:hypothetical protein GDO86_013295 [Hymenochirus boettgeri]|uniref:RNA/RNP complex-1-interacting phosphatase n=1 Tax=Hymenochirus boettgeri TaxID=247094 RepID=A0A8T2IW65_9PIPI|nr:hypothetical protein GDO86_013295 [Hymenochirus boettgeri]